MRNRDVSKLKLDMLSADSGTETNSGFNFAAGIPPFLRGPYSTMYTQRPWTIRQYAGFSTAQDSNRFYKKNLAEGQKGLSVAFDLATHRGYDSDHPRVVGDVGMAGVAIDTVEDMKILFDTIPLQDISVSMTMNGAVLPVLAFYIIAAEEQGVSPEQLSGTLQNDILKEFMVRNTYIYPPEASMRITMDIIRYTSEHMPRFNPISISGYHMQEAGATPALELAYTLADGLEYVEGALASGLTIDEFAPRLSFFWGIGMDHFMEIAKLRAARMLWAKLIKPFQPKNPKSMMLRAHSQTSGYSLAAQDPYNNITRTTIEATAAILGGTQSLHTNSMDEAIALPTEEAARIARNTQLYLQQETGMTYTVDPWGGSHYVEKLTQDIADQTWDLLQEIKEIGGMTIAVELGIPQERIEAAAATKQARLDSLQDQVIGVNTKIVENEEKIGVLQVDNQKVRSIQNERLRTIREERNNDQVRNILNQITEAAKNKSPLIELTLEAARQRASLGEISMALEKAFGRHAVKPIIHSGVYESSIQRDPEFTRAKKQIEKFQQIRSRKPRILIAKTGQDGHDRGAKVVASAYSDIGFDVLRSPLFQTPKEIYDIIIKEKVDIVGVSSLAGGHKTLIPQLLTFLQQSTHPCIVIAGGIIPEEEHKELYALGVAAIFGPGTKISTAASDLIDVLLGAKNKAIS